MHSLLHNYLLQYKQVAIPGIGLFTIEQEPSSLDFANKILHPPLPVIRFKPDTVVADGRFYKYISRHFNLNETEAIRRFNDFAFDFKNDIVNNGEAELPGIGKVIKAVSNTYSFLPQTSLQEYFPGIKVERIIRENTEHNVLVGEDEKTSTQMQELLAEKPQTDRWWIYAIILATVAVGVIVYYHVTHKG